jgi:hypothetical protein
VRALSVSVRREEGEDGREEEDDGVRRRTGTGPGGLPRWRGRKTGWARERKKGPSAPSPLFFFLLSIF